MDCTQEELKNTNVFQSSILIPLTKMFNVYAKMRHELSPDEFCILLFAKEETREKCKSALNANSVRNYFEDLEDFKVSTIQVQNVIVDLFMNVVRYERFLEAISKDFLTKQRCRDYGDLREVMVLVYVLMYRICSLFFEDSIDCFVHFKMKKILMLVSYLLRSETSNLLHQKGCAVFEEDFVERKLVLPFLEATPCLEKLQDHLKEAIRKLKPSRKEPTVPVFMNVLNRQRARSMVPPPTPVDLTVVKFSREIPRTNYAKPSTETKLESLRAANKLHAMNLLKDANEKAPSCSQRRKDTMKVTEKKEPRTAIVRKSVPVFKPVEVKMTTASILRECARVISDEEKEIKKLKALTEGGLDPSAILKLEEEKRQQQREEELLKIQEKHLLALLSREGALIAKQSLLNDLKLHGENVRKEKQELYEKLENWRQNHNTEMMEIVEKCREIEQASREAFTAMIDEKRQKAAEISEESRQLRAQAIKQREDETRRKIKLIQEIKTIQSLRALPYKDFDPTESSGLGLLCEMSLAELKERLFWMNMKLNEEVGNRKNFIHREREKQKANIRNTQKALKDYKINKRAESLFKSQQKPVTVSSPEIEALRKKLEERRAVRLQKESAFRSK